MDNNLILCIIVTYNPSDILKLSIDKIQNQVNKIVIVDNNSQYNTHILDFVKKNSKAEVLFNEKNYGIAYALNQGVKYAIENNYKWVLTMDQDSIAQEDMLEKMLSVYNQLPTEQKDKVMSIFPRYYEESGLKINNKKSKNKEKIKEACFISTGITSGNLIKTEVFLRVGLFEERLFIDYVDHEFCLRLGKYGYKLIQVDNAYLSHKLGDSEVKKVVHLNIGCTNHSYIRRYYITRNRIYVWKKYVKSDRDFVFHDILAFFREIVKILMFESDKGIKLKMIIIGIKDCEHGNFIKRN